MVCCIDAAPSGSSIITPSSHRSLIHIAVAGCA